MVEIWYTEVKAFCKASSSVTEVSAICIMLLFWIPMKEGIASPYVIYCGTFCVIHI